MKSEKPKKKKKKKPRYTAKTADKHELYQLAVQEPEVEVKFLSRVFKKQRGRVPVTLREDFCGTALFCGAWVSSRAERTAVGIDIDPDVLSWGKQRNLAPLGEAAERIQLICGDVRDPLEGKFDVCCAFNFSYWCFQERKMMIEYFRGVRSSLADDGVFFLDAYGGYESHEPDLEEPRKIDEGFTYVWHQDEVDPINNTIVNHIHFHFKDKTRMRKAFSYHWRFWSLREIREMLEEAGFAETSVYWEDADEEGEGTGVYRKRVKAANEAAWVAYIVAEV